MRVIATRLLALLVRPADDTRLETWFGRRRIQRAMFAAMVASFDPRSAEGFQGRLVYELLRPETRRPAVRWTVEVRDGRAFAHPGSAEDPALTLRVRLADFIRIAAGTLDPVVPMLQNRATFEGDLGLAVRLPEMFGAPRPR
jgi:hypothetical protein